MATLQYLLSKTLKPLRTQKAYREAMLIHDWENIVGGEFARCFMPIGIQTNSSSKVLLLQAGSSGMATARYVEPMLLELVNRFFGSPYIASIKVSQGSVKRVTKVRSPIAEISPKNLEEALQSIGKHLGITQENA